jgi:hypothetical protein
MPKPCRRLSNGSPRTKYIRAAKAQQQRSRTSKIITIMVAVFLLFGGS